jgi:hypothetical protein
VIFGELLAGNINPDRPEHGEIIFASSNEPSTMP